MSESSDDGLVSCLRPALDDGAVFEEPGLAERMRGTRGVVGLRPPRI